jgi:hypothetical protein
MLMIDPKYLCKNHLLGEHNEIHKHRNIFEKKHSIKNRISPIVQIEPDSMSKRHDDLMNEMLRRGYNHKSNYIQPDLSYLNNTERYAKVDTNISINDLKNRCILCKKNLL